MRRYLSLCLLALMLASPAHAKGKIKEKSHSAMKSNFALMVDLSTGGCEVQMLGFQADPPLGVKVLGLYEMEKEADAAEGSSAECQNKPLQDDSARVHAVEQDCQARARKSDSTLFSLFSDLASGGSKQQAYAACMKAYNVNH